MPAALLLRLAAHSNLFQPPVTAGQDHLLEMLIAIFIFKSNAAVLSM
jgi:hypothetical protein